MARRSVLKLYHINEYFRKFDDSKGSETQENDFDTIFASDQASKKLKKAELHKQFRRGEKAYEANHVKSFAWDPSHKIVKGSVRASMKTSNYTTTVSIVCVCALTVSAEVSVVNLCLNLLLLQVFLNEDYSVKDAKCTCARGTACHHLAALLICAHYNISVTDIECTWKAKKTAERNDGLSFDQLFPQKKVYNAVSEPTEEELKKMYDTLPMCGRGGAGMAWLLQPEPQGLEAENNSDEEDTPQCVSIPSIMDIIKSTEFSEATNQFQYLMSSAKLTHADIRAIASSTVGQNLNPLWTEARLFRFNGSKLGDVIHAAVKRRKLCESLIKSLFERVKVRTNVVKNVKGGKYKDVGVNAAQWGQDHEADAKKKFTEKTGLKVEETGIWIHETGLWASSPDGLVGNDAVLEIKCPFQFRAAKSFKECLMNEEEFFNTAPSKRYALYYDEDLDKFILWDDHNYYHQVQGELWCTLRDLCYFAVWTVDDIAITEVERSDSWYTDNVPRLLDKYEKEFLPRLLKMRE